MRTLANRFGGIVHIDGIHACIKCETSGVLTNYYANTLTVIEAAKPEVGDSVRLDVDSRYVNNAAIIEDMSTGRDRFLLAGCYSGSKGYRWHNRDTFTITHKAKGE